MSDEHVALPPSARTSPNATEEQLSSRAPECLALIILWSAREPHRVGEAALITNAEPVWILGRAPSPEYTEHLRSTQAPDYPAACTPEVPGAPLLFFRQRPLRVRDAHSPSDAQPSLGGESISRRQLAFTPSPSGMVVKNIGRCELLVNGQVTAETILHAGDTLYLRNQLLLYCTYRPIEFQPLKAYPHQRIAAFGKPDLDGMVGESPLMWKLRERLATYARTNFHVLVLGDSGSGKELAAQAIHRLSERASRKLIADNISAIPPSLASAILFGNKKNFPNPGMEERTGLIGSAHGSSLFLDEIGDMPEEVQPMFLRVTDKNREYVRLGEESRVQRSDFRLIGATNRPEKVRYELKRRFQREVYVPGINQRKEDIPLLIQHLLLTQAEDDDLDVARFIRGGFAAVHPLLVEQLVHHTYSTHVSEIAFLLGKAMAESEHHVIQPLGSSLRLEQGDPPAPAKAASRRRPQPLPPMEKVESMLLECKGNISRAASALHISRHQLNRLLGRREAAHHPPENKTAS